MSGKLHVWAIEPYYGGSHRAFLDALVRWSRHRWTLLTGKPVHWKWRMRSAPMHLTRLADHHLRSEGPPDVLFCTDMLDLPTWRGLRRGDVLSRVPTVVYFHENQWSYPVAPTARPDFHFGYTNLLSVIASDQTWFNSTFNRDDFFEHSAAFLRRMPDSAETHELQQLRDRCCVVPPGFDPPATLPARSEHDVLQIGWTSRWEHDKRPDLFLKLLRNLDARAIDFQLILVGPRPRREVEAHRCIQNEFADRIRFDGYASTREAYWQQLRQMDVVVSCADHEFFGIAICEAVWAGACPVAPARLSYPELLPADCLYQSIEEAAEKIRLLSHASARQAMRLRCQQKLEPLQMKHLVVNIDDRLAMLSSSAAEKA